MFVDSFVVPVINKPIIISEEFIYQCVDFLLEFGGLRGNSREVDWDFPAKDDAFSSVAYWNVRVGNESRHFSISGGGSRRIIFGAFLPAKSGRSSASGVTCSTLFFRDRGGRVHRSMWTRAFLVRVGDLWSLLGLLFLLGARNFGPWVGKRVETGIVFPRRAESINLKSGEGMLGKIRLGAMLRPLLEFKREIHLTIQVVVCLVPNGTQSSFWFSVDVLHERIEGVTVGCITTKREIAMPKRGSHRVTVLLLAEDSNV